MNFRNREPSENIALKSKHFVLKILNEWHIGDLSVQVKY